jgi:hypothetical protein
MLGLNRYLPAGPLVCLVERLERFPVVLNQQRIKARHRRACPGDLDSVAPPCHTIEVAGTSPAMTRGEVVQM